MTSVMTDGRYDQYVSDMPPPPPAPSPPSRPSAGPPPRRPQWPIFAVSAVALLVTLGVAIVGWFRPEGSNRPVPPPAASTYSDQQRVEAKAKVCAAYEKVHHAVLANTGRSGGTDPALLLGVAANARLALYEGGEYLTKALGQEPATPADLAGATRALANAYQELALDYMTEASDTEVQSAFQTVESTGSKVSGMCR